MPSKLPSLNRMKLEHILAKLEQIERQAELTLSEYPGGLSVERQRLIAGLASQLQTYVRDQLRAGQRRSDLGFDSAPDMPVRHPRI